MSDGGVPDVAKFLSKAVQDQQKQQGAAQVWAEITALAQMPGVLDLGQGWPDFGANQSARQTASAVMLSEDDPRSNQYSPIGGRPELLNALSRYFATTGLQSPELDPKREILVSTSATEALYAAMQAFCDPGDEVVFLEPFFPWYVSHVKIFGAVPVTVRLEPPDFALDLDKLRKAFTS